MTTRSLGDAAMGLLAAIDRASHLAADADLQAVVAAAARAVHAAVGARHVAIAVHAEGARAVTASAEVGDAGDDSVVGGAVVPLVTGERVIGALTVTADDEALGEWRPVLALVASRLAVTIDHARLLREQRAARAKLQATARELALLNDIAVAATDDLALRPMLARIVTAMHHGFGWEFVACIRIDRARDCFVCEAVATTLPTEVHVGYSRPLGSGVVGEVAATGRAIVIDDVTTWPNYVETLPGARSELCVPAIYRGEVVALLNLESPRPAAFRDQVGLLTTVAEQVAGAIASARLFDEVSDRNRVLTDLFSRYVAPELVSVLLTDPERFRSVGERREVSVLFADIRGFTGLAQALDSQAVMGLLNEFYAEMGEAIFGHRGSINRILGDGLMAVFGVPERLDDHAGAAVAAALAMHARVEALAPSWAARTGRPLEVAMAINTGEVAVGSIGDPRHLAFTVIGDVVNVAARLETEAKVRGARLLVTDAVIAAYPGVEHEALGAIELRGRVGAVAIHRLL